MDSIKLDDQGNLTGLDDQVKSIRKSDSYLFNEGDPTTVTVTKFHTNPVTIKLSGGTTTPRDVSDMMNDALENEHYSVATTAGMDVTSNIHKLFVETIKRLRETEGKKVRGVIPVTVKAPEYNYEGVSMIANGYLLGDGT